MLVDMMAQHLLAALPLAKFMARALKIFGKGTVDHFIGQAS